MWLMSKKSNIQLPSLTLVGIPYGTHESPIDLKCLLYLGGAAIRSDQLEKAICSGSLGPPQHERLPIVKQFYDDLCADISKGLSRVTITNYFKYLRQIFTWSDIHAKKITKDNIEHIFYEWADSKSDEIFRKVSKHRTVHRIARVINYLIVRALKTKGNLLEHTRLQKPGLTNGKKSDKQNLEQTFEFGHALFDISNALTTETIMGGLPVIINCRDKGELIEWASLRPPEQLKSLQKNADPWNRKKVLEARKAWEDEKSFRTRYSLINLKIECEILIFLAQTGMNLSQALIQKRGKFKYQSCGDSVNVFNSFKKRRQGGVIFQIFREYTTLFNKYLKWLEDNFPAEETRLFPFIHLSVLPHEGKSRAFQAVPSRCKKLGIRFIPPRELRSTRINWLLRKSLDPNLTAEIAQHTKETLINVYQIPHHQRAAIEITRFHQATDPSIAPPGPGFCAQVNSAAKAIDGRPDEAPEPDCISPSGCLFCFFHRDVDTFDYVWSLASLRYCKRLELDRHTPSQSLDRQSHPAVLVIDRISEKIDFFRESSEERFKWTIESANRIREGRYHPNFDGLIRLMELA